MRARLCRCRSGIHYLSGGGVDIAVETIVGVVVVFGAVHSGHGHSGGSWAP